MTFPIPDLSAERALLGSILLNADALEDVGHIEAADFYAHHHRWVWNAYVCLTEQGIRPDVVTVSNELDRVGQLVEVGGTAYLTRLIDECASSLNAASYARLVLRDRDKRALVEMGTRLANIGLGGQDDPKALLSEIERTLSGQGGSTARPVSEIASLVWDEVADPDAAAGRMVKTGLEAWDHTLGGGLDRGTLGIVMARPGMGKTALLVQVADYVSERGGVVAVFSKEMTSRQWLLRTACRRVRVSLLALRQKTASAEERQRVLNELAALSERRTLILDDSAPQTTDDVRAICDRLARTVGLALVVADHLRLFADVGDNENKRQGNISWSFKRLAKNLDVPVLCAAQLNRGVEQGSPDNRKPDLKDLRDSGEIEENADTVTALYRDSYYSANPLDNTSELINRKSRDGERNARARFAFLARYMSFEPLAKGTSE